MPDDRSAAEVDHDDPASLPPEALRIACDHQHRARFKSGVRAAATWLSNRAMKMNDPNAMAILNSAATNLGWDLAANRVPDGGLYLAESPTWEEYERLRDRAVCAHGWAETDRADLNALDAFVHHLLAEAGRAVPEAVNV